MNKFVKLVIAALMVACGIYLMMNRNIGWGLVVVILSALPVALFFKNEYSLLSFWQLRKQNFQKALDWLHHIKNFKTQLHRSQWGYFHYLQGLCIAQDSPKQVEAFMKKAMEYGLNMKPDRAMATLNLAAGALTRGNKTEATRLLEETKRLDTAGMLTDQIKMLKDQLKVPNMRKHAHNPNMRIRGKFN